MVYDNSNSCPPSPELTASLADRSVVEFLSLWVNPPVGTVKINCDAAWDKVTNAAFDGVVIRDHTGILLDGIAHCFQSLSVVQAECHAIRSGLELAHVRGFTNVIVETDSKVGFTAVQEDISVSNWTLCPILYDIRMLKASFSSLRWAWTPRDANHAADWGCFLELTSLVGLFGL
ncbi:hypothetical protein PRUPE_1G073500 [Prunus persica]|uniref:RNase H type-1 domain-containing protein n=1 Tax=Prunus persica TaxID=3760 RepID=A0A251QTN4_PRUPE|nr:hypothetical protein PRUPE_1G073500 [Prunus persica]